jgi:predicted nucleic acid-binding protein
MVAAMCTWHERHEAAAGELNRRLANREAMLVGAPALVESYAVLTRLPPPHRLSSADAFALIEGNFIDVGRLIALDGGSYRSVLRNLAQDGIAGGRAYDAVIVRCAVKAKATVLLTFNTRDFAPLAPPQLTVVVPEG